MTSNGKLDQLPTVTFMIAAADQQTRLYDAPLPTEKSSLRKLIDLFFSRVHQLRCTGFIHPPSFMHSFDRGTLVEDYGEALIYIICAFGAR